MLSEHQHVRYIANRTLARIIRYQSTTVGYGVPIHFRVRLQSDSMQDRTLNHSVIPKVCDEITSEPLITYRHQHAVGGTFHVNILPRVVRKDKRRRWRERGQSNRPHDICVEGIFLRHLKPISGSPKKGQKIPIHVRTEARVRG